MIHKWKVTIPKLTEDLERDAYIYLPDSYLSQPDINYPVLYMFDGHNLFFDEDATFGKCWGLKEYMDFTETQLIIVGVECNQDAENGRLKEYSPFSFYTKSLGKIPGKGDLTMDWFVHTLKPYIDSNFRTLPDRKHTFIAGSSMGGLMSLYALLAYNDTFSRAAALSPSLWTNPRAINQLIQRTRLNKDTVLYMDYGENELQNHKAMLHNYTKICSRLMERGVLLTQRLIPNGDHSEASWERQVPYFIETLLYDLED